MVSLGLRKSTVPYGRSDHTDFVTSSSILPVVEETPTEGADILLCRPVY